MDKHKLEIYDTKDLDHPLITFESEIPFQTISVGDVLWSHAWPATTAERVEVTSVEHDISISSPMWHQTTVLTKPIGVPAKVAVRKLGGV